MLRWFWIFYDLKGLVRVGGDDDVVIFNYLLACYLDSYFPI